MPGLLQRAAIQVGLVAVEVDGRRFAIAASGVQTILRMVATTPLLDAPAGVDGLIDLHGQTVAVVDVRTCLGLERRPALVTDHLVVMDTPRGLLALRVDRAIEFMDHQDLEQVTAAATGPSNVVRVARTPAGLLVIVDPDALFEEADWAAVADALVEAART